jgi:hypothetical protein
MKKVFFIIVIALFSLNINAQKMNKNFLIGKWKSNTVEIEVSIKNQKQLNITAFSYLSGENFKILGYQINNKNLYLKMLHESNDWESLAKFIIIDEDTMVADYVANVSGQMIYKRISNN